MANGLPGMAACAGERANNPGGQNGVPAACPSSPGCVSGRAAGEGRYIAPLDFGAAPDVAFARLNQMLIQRSDTRDFEVISASRRGCSGIGMCRSRMEEVCRQFLATEGKP
jgi:uncharacterized protein (DUF1499 family)